MAGNSKQPESGTGRSFFPKVGSLLSPKERRKLRMFLRGCSSVKVLLRPELMGWMSTFTGGGRKKINAQIKEQWGEPAWKEFNSYRRKQGIRRFHLLSASSPIKPDQMALTTKRLMQDVWQVKLMQDRSFPFFLAWMRVLGVPIKQIALMTGLTQATIKVLVTEKALDRAALTLHEGRLVFWVKVRELAWVQFITLFFDRDRVKKLSPPQLIQVLEYSEKMILKFSSDEERVKSAVPVQGTMSEEELEEMKERHKVFEGLVKGGKKK